MLTCTRPSLTALALLLAVAAPACSSFGGGSDRTDDSAPAPDPQATGADSGTDAPGTQAPPVDGTPDNDKITEAAGVFVAPSGDDSADGSRGRPLKTLSAAITTATRIGKIVFACTGTYSEALVVSDSISIIGGLDCADPTKWKTGAAPSRIESPTSPAVTAKSINAPTRLEALDIVAPNATRPGESSLGLLADHAPNLTIVSSKITAGNGADGTNGSDGAQLGLGPNAKGKDSAAGQLCVPPAGVVPGTCGFSPIPPAGYHRTPGGAGGIGQCLGAAGHDNAGGGGNGGGSGVYQTESGVILGVTIYDWVAYHTLAAASGDLQTGAGGNAGADGAAPAEIGGLTSEGYLPEDGHGGKDGAPGSGGSGGKAGDASDYPSAKDHTTEIWASPSGPGGGAGGCPGLAGSPGTGGGASLGVALVASPLVLDSVTITSAKAGAGGRGSLGSDPTLGGEPGQPIRTAGAAAPGGRGGEPGVSTNGANGPSIGILHTGGAPVLKGTTKASSGTTAPGIGARARGDGSTRVIPATPAGIIADIKSL